MNYIYIFLAFLIAFVGVYANNLINRLEKDNEKLNTSLNMAINANNSYKATIEQMQQDYIKGLETLSAIKNEKEKEVRYVTTIKEKIIRDNNSTCIDAINSIYARLHEQRDTDNNASK
ncbi:hypothetical protein CHL_1002 [Campylobacter hyointestinalis subsp. lawsonii CCUG 27631]|uniref:hypothetical protein n=1 Tax=Campylobacter hyointestinalis TaxID=198 RepID=UPI0007C9B8E6|nr:hypothetical protein [Campylobacter hyointestinalis]ANE34349.1 hypothetical protein CHL_1002 [Campylobacter hyointestinalis subsp. lawsonii CCUG 27631]